MVRLEGAAVSPLALTMLGDWMLETVESLDQRRRLASARKAGIEPTQIGQ